MTEEDSPTFSCFFFPSFSGSRAAPKAREQRSDLTPLCWISHRRDGDDGEGKKRRRRRQQQPRVRKLFQYCGPDARVNRKITSRAWR